MLIIKCCSAKFSQSKIIYFLIFCLIFAQTVTSLVQTCSSVSDCPTDSFCQSNSYCACDPGYIVDCSIEGTQLSNNFISSEVSGNYSYYIMTPSVLNQYLKFQITICNSQGGLTQTISMWGQTGYLTNLTTTNMLASANIFTTTQCFTIQTGYFQFGLQPNGQCQVLYLGLMVNSTSQFNVSIKVEESLAYNSDIFNLITTIVMAIGTVGVLVILIYCLIKRRRERLARERSQQVAVKNDTAHFDQQMPVISAAQVQMMPQQVCSVCLSQIQRSDQIRVTVCNHIFHSQCIDSWCKKNINCPICRQDLTLEALQRFMTQRQSQGMNQLEMIQRSNQDRQKSIIWSVNNNNERQMHQNIEQIQMPIQPLEENNNIRQRML